MKEVPSYCGRRGGGRTGNKEKKKLCHAPVLNITKARRKKSPKKLKQPGTQTAEGKKKAQRLS